MSTQPQIKGVSIVVDGLEYISIKTKKISAAFIAPQPEVVNGMYTDEKKTKIEIVKSSTKPVFQEDSVPKIIAMMKDNGFTAEDLFPDREDPDAVLVSMTMAVAQGLAEFPLSTYSKIYTTLGGDEIPKSSVKKFMVQAGEGEADSLVEFPVLSKTRIFNANDSTVQPRIYWDEMLRAGDKVYEVYADSKQPGARHGLYKLAKRMEAWEYTDPKHPKVGKTEEVMMVVEPVVLTGGSTQEYIALIAPKRIITVDGEEKFVFIMKMCQSNVAYQNSMDVPLEGETPLPAQVQKPIRMSAFGALLAQVKNG